MSNGLWLKRNLYKAIVLDPKLEVSNEKSFKHTNKDL